MKVSVYDRLRRLSKLRKQNLQLFIHAAEHRLVLTVLVNLFLIAFMRTKGAISKVRMLWRTGFGRFPIPLGPSGATLKPGKATEWLSRCESQPLISVVVPVYKVDCQWMEKCINSVYSQYYQRWQLILVDDASEIPELTGMMKRWASRDGRIELISLRQNGGIARATNAGIAAAKGEFVAFLDHDDELTPDALTWVVAAHNRYPGAEWFYSDECKIDEEGKRFAPFFKPAYSPDFLLSQMYTCHLSVYSRTLLQAVKGIREGFDGSQDHDLALRVSEQLTRDQVVHIPRILYHWRALKTSTASSSEAKPYASLAGQRAVRDALKRRGIRAEVHLIENLTSCYRIETQTISPDHVTVIIPTRNALHDLRQCIESVWKSPGHTNFEVVVINNRSDDPATLEYLEAGEKQGEFRVFHYDQPFNHSEMHNIVVEQCRSEYLVFLNNDVQILSDNWLSTMIATSQLSENIAGVGAKLLYPDGTLQHGGIVVGLGGCAGHEHKNLPGDSPGYFGRAQLLHETSGCTAAMLLLKRDAFLEVGGFDAEAFPTSFNDVDLWLRLQRAGFRCLYTPSVSAIHFESKTRPILADTEVQYIERIWERWGNVLPRDRFYNPNLSLDNEQYNGYREFPVVDFEADSDQFRCHPQSRRLELRPRLLETA